MSTLSIEVRDDGTVVMKVGDHNVSLVDELVLTAGRDGPSVEVMFINIDALEECSEEDRSRLHAAIRSLRGLLSKNPYVHFTNGDTLPSPGSALRRCSNG